MGKLSADRIRRLDEIGFDWDLTKGQRIWEVMFAKLCAFKKQHGHCDLKNRSAGSFVLRSWLEDQLRFFANNRLANDRLEQLKSVGVVFDVLVKEPNQAREIMFERLLAYKAKYGDCDVPRNFYGIDRLAWWVVCQRKLYAEGKLERDFIRRLDEIGFIWDRKEHLWRKMYSAASQLLHSGGIAGLEAYIQHAGESNGELRKWVEAQQSAKKRRVLSPQKQSELDKIGFPWQFPKKPKVPTKPSWESIFVKLVEFQKMHGHCDMKLVHPFDEHLHTWAQVQRQARESGVLTVDQIRELNQIGFIWQTDDLLWERMLKALVAYKATHSDCAVPRYSQQDSQLAIWVASQRKQRAKGELKQDRIDRIAALGFQW
jgi:hypothetical protein